MPFNMPFHFVCYFCYSVRTNVTHKKASVKRCLPTKASDVISRLKSELKIDTDAELCRLMNISTANLANWKSRGYLNEKPIVAFCVQRQIDLNWILTGTRIAMSHTNDGSSHTNNDLLVQTLLKTVDLLEKRIKESEKTLARAEEVLRERELQDRLLKESQDQVIKLQEELLATQKQLRAATAEIAALKKKKAT